MTEQFVSIPMLKSHSFKIFCLCFCSVFIFYETLKSKNRIVLIDLQGVQEDQIHETPIKYHLVKNISIANSLKNSIVWVSPSFRYFDFQFNFNRVRQTFGNQCDKIVYLDKLELLDNQTLLDNKIVFIETSGRSWLTPRETCSLESAASFSNLPVLFLTTSAFLDLHQNSTCQLYQSSLNIRYIYI